MVPGRFLIPPQDVAVTWTDPETGEASRDVLRTEPLAFAGVVPEAAKGLDPFVAADTLEMVQVIEGAPGDLVPDGSRTERVVLVAEGGGGGEVPPISLDWYDLQTGKVETAVKDRKSNRLHPSIRRRELPVTGLLDLVEDGMERSLGQAKPGEALGRQVSGRSKGGFREAGNRGSGQTPKRRSPSYTRIEFVVRLRLGEGIARKSLFIEKDGCAVLLLP
jgi:hypothetical protein